MYGGDIMSIEMVCRQVTKFQAEERTDIHNMSQSGQPSDVINTDAITAVCVVVDSVS